jgi:tRNA uridine 5-carboxymethylaminomethyl modification enzyme
MNAVLKLKGRDPLILSRAEAYIGVLIDDLVTKGTTEPYRMFTSRAEYRLLLRHDNADLRLMDHGYRMGLIPDSLYRKRLVKRKAVEAEIVRLRNTRVRMTEDARNHLESLNIYKVPGDLTLAQLLKRQSMNHETLNKLFPPEEMDHDPSDKGVWEQVEIQIKYEGYIERQSSEVDRYKRMEARAIPPGFQYDGIPGLSREVREKLAEIRPVSIGQASRISGITPSAISILLVALEQSRRASGGRREPRKA